MSIKHKVFRGIFWVALGGIATEGAKFISKIILARILAPEDFGLMATVLFITACFGLFQEGGFESALVQTNGDVNKASEVVFLVTPFIGLGLSFLLFSVSGLIAAYYAEPRLLIILKLVSPLFLIASLRSVPSGLLERNMDFKKKIPAELFSVAGYVAISLTLGSRGFGVWSLIGGYMASIFIMTCAVWIIVPWRPRFLFDIRVAKSLFHFGKHLVGIGILAFLLMQGDIAFIGKYLGHTALGFYSMAYTFGNITTFQITNMISRVTYPAFSAVQADKERLRFFFLSTIKYTMFIILPVTAGIFGLADTIPRILGSRWDLAIFPQALRILCIFSFFRSLHIVSGILLMSVGKPYFLTKALIGELAAFVFLVYPLTKALYIAGTALTMACILASASIWLLNVCLSITGIRWKDVFDSIKVSFSASVIMGSILFSLGAILKHMNPFIQLFLLSLIGAGIYLAFMISTERASIINFFLFLSGKTITAPITPK